MHAKNLIRQHMTFAKGGDPLKETISVADVITHAEALVPQETGIARVWDVEEDLWAADLDVSQITQVFQNLIINAHQAMRDGGKITIHMSNTQITEGDTPPGYDPVMANYQSYGFLSRVVKPYRMEKLADAVNAVLERKGS